MSATAVLIFLQVSLLYRAYALTLHTILLENIGGAKSGGVNTVGVPPTDPQLFKTGKAKSWGVFRDAESRRDFTTGVPPVDGELFNRGVPPSPPKRILDSHTPIFPLLCKDLDQIIDLLVLTTLS